MSGGVDVTNILLDLAAISVPVMGLFAREYANRFLAAHNDQADQAYVDSVIDQASQLALNEAQIKLKGAPVTIDLHNQVVNDALQHVLSLADDERTKLGYTDADLAKLIAAQFSLSGGTVSIAGAPPPPAPAQIKSQGVAS